MTGAIAAVLFFCRRRRASRTSSKISSSNRMNPRDPPTAAPTVVAVAALLDEVQFPDFDAPADDVVPAGQFSHALEPGALLKVPAAHMRHEVAPAAGEKDPALQLWHARSEVAPETLDQAPGAQDAHAETPARLDHVPATQGWHVELSVAPICAENHPRVQFWHTTAVLLVAGRTVKDPASHVGCDDEHEPLASKYAFPRHCWHAPVVDAHKTQYCTFTTGVPATTSDSSDLNARASDGDHGSNDPVAWLMFHADMKVPAIFAPTLDSAFLGRAPS